MTDIRRPPTHERRAERVTEEEAVRLMKVFECIPAKSDRDAVVEFASRLAALTSGDGMH